jgi:hypothetical protein
LATPGAARAQIQIGTVRGTVSDPAGARLPGARLTLQDPVIDDVRRFADGVFNALLDIQNILLKTNPGDERRAVFINDLGVKTTDFQLSDQTKWDLIAQGRVATSKCLSRPRPSLPEVKRLLLRRN